MKRALPFVGLVSLVLLACSGEPGEKGDPGAPGAAGDTGDGSASVSGITPGRAFLARSLDVTISGSGTTWGDGTTVDFGEGVTVEKVTVASPTAMVASLKIAAAATVGPRDVKVVSGKNEVTYKGAFTVESPISLSVRGTAAQGSIFFVTAQNLDLASPFDTSSEGGLFSPTVYTGISVEDVPGMTISVSDVALYKVEMTVIVDVTAAGGSKPISLLSGTPGTNQVSFPFPQGVEIAERQATALTLGSASNQTVTDPFESKLFKFTPTAAPGLVDVIIQGKSGLEPKGIVLPESGVFAEALSGFAASSMLLSTSTKPLYVVALDTSGETGSFTITAQSTAAATVAKTADNSTSAKAQAIAALPTIVTDAALSSGTDANWYSITATAGDVGKKLRVVTAPGDPNSDTVVEVFESDASSPVGEKTDDNYHENFLSPALASAGKYYVKISFSDQSKWSAGMSKYQLALRLE